MALVSRRTLQRLLDENAKMLTEDQTRKHVQTLNSGGASALAAEYEVLLINGLDRFGKVVHEPALSGPRRPDILLRLKKPVKGVLVADITTVSDADAFNENPQEEFSREFYRVLAASGLTASGFGMEINGLLVGAPGRQKMKLSLPRKGAELRQVVGREVRPFVESVKRDLSLPRKLRLSNYDVVITYEPGGRYMSGSFRSFTVPYSVENNPLMNALRNKAEQLKGTGFDGIRGVLVCDGHCDSVRSIAHLTGGYAAHVRTEEIVSAFLRRRTSISFVWMVTVTEPLPSHQPTARAFLAKLFVNPKAKHLCTPEMIAALEGLAGALPSPARTPVNALHFLNSDRSLPDSSYNSFNGGLWMNSREIRLSSRTLVRLLAGRVSLEEFLREHHFAGPPPTIPFFENQLKAGRTLVSARVDRVPDDDDDWIVLTFDGPDSAIAPFRVPDDAGV